MLGNQFRDYRDLIASTSKSFVTPHPEPVFLRLGNVGFSPPGTRQRTRIGQFCDFLEVVDEIGANSSSRVRNSFGLTSSGHGPANCEAGVFRVWPLGLRTRRMFFGVIPSFVHRVAQLAKADLQGICVCHSPASALARAVFFGLVSTCPASRF